MSSETALGIHEKNCCNEYTYDYNYDEITSGDPACGTAWVPGHSPRARRPCFQAPRLEDQGLRHKIFEVPKIRDPNIVPFRQP